MSDIATVWDNTIGEGDWLLAGADLKSGQDLMTQVLVSLFSNRTARATDVIPSGSPDRQGWWGTSGESPELGSRLWLLDRAKLSLPVALQAEQYAAEGLQWMIDDGVVAAFEIAAQIRQPSTLILTIAAFRTTAAKKAKNFAWTWTGTVLYPPGGASATLETEAGLRIVL